MARQVLGGLTTLNLATNLDPMFAEIYSGAFAGMTFSAGNVSIGTSMTPYRLVVSNGSGTSNLEFDTGGGYVAGGNAIASYNRGGSVYQPFAFSGSYVATFIGGTERFRIDATGAARPAVDNALSCGMASFRWSVVYAGTGTINTSDAREKTEVRHFTADELAASKQIGREIGTFKFLSAVAEKNSGARTHIGMTVQRVIQIMRSYQLDPFAYGFICYDEWPEEVIPAKYRPEGTGVFDSQGREITRDVEYEAKRVLPAGNRYGFRADELALFIMRGICERLDASGA